MEIKESKHEAEFTFASGRFSGTLHLFEHHYDVSQRYHKSFGFWWGIGSLERGPEILKEWGFEDVVVFLQDKRQGRALLINSFADCVSADGPHLTIALVGKFELHTVHVEPPKELVIVDARRRSESEVMVVFEVDGGSRQTEVIRREGSESDISIWNSIDERNNVDIICQHGKEVFGRLIGVAERILAGEKVELPIVYRKANGARDSSR